MKMRIVMNVPFLSPLLLASALPCQGNITSSLIFEVLPFSNVVSIKEMTGAEVLASIEWGLTSTATWAGRFPQVCGVVVLCGVKLSYELSIGCGSMPARHTILKVRCFGLKLLGCMAPHIM